MTRQTHVYKVRFNDTVTCHVTAPSATRAIAAAIRWRNYTHSIATQLGDPRAPSETYNPRDIRSCEHLCTIDRVPRP